MEYRIHNKWILQTEGFIRSFEDELQRKTSKLEKVLKGFHKTCILNVYLHEEAGTNYSIITSLRLNDKDLIVQEVTNNPVAAINNLLDKLALQVKKELPKIRKEHLFKRKRNALNVGELLAQLEQHRQHNDKKQFDQVLVKLLPTLKEYILTYLNENGSRKKTSLTIEEIIDEAYLEMYNRLPQRPRDEQQFIPWIYTVIKEYLDNKVIAVSQPADSDSIQINLDSLAAKELASLQETYTVNAEGQPVLEEDLDDISYLLEYTQQNNQLEGALIHLPQDPEIKQQTAAALKNVGPKERLAFKMFWNQLLSEKEIARLFNTETTQIENWISQTASSILQNLKIVRHEEL